MIINFPQYIVTLVFITIFSLAASALETKEFSEVSKEGPGQNPNQILRWAILNGHREQLKKSFELGADPNYVSEKMAVDNSISSKSKKWLLNNYWHGAEDQNAAFDAVACLGFTVITLISHGLWLPIWATIEGGVASYVYKRNEHRSQIRLNPLGPKQAIDYMTPLLCITSESTRPAVSWKLITEIIRDLIDVHADVNKVDTFGNSALMNVVYARSQYFSLPKQMSLDALQVNEELECIDSLIEMLIFAGASPDVRNNYHLSPFEFASYDDGESIRNAQSKKERIIAQIQVKKLILQDVLKVEKLALIVIEYLASMKKINNENIKWFVYKYLRDFNDV